MSRVHRCRAATMALALVASLGLSCGISQLGADGAVTTPPLPAEEAFPLEPEEAQPLPPPIHPNAPPGKWALWSGGTHLRGANIYQRRVYPALDGSDFMGSGPVGPPFTQQDFDQLAGMGANYVNISHPGVFAETPPFALEPDAQANLDSLLTMIAQADMFAVISFRTGPGRSEFTFFWDEVGDWFDESYLNDSIWQDQAAQDAWADMWRHTAERYRDHPIVVGYDLMVEPNSNEVGSHALNDPLDIWNPAEFYATHGGSLYDWNQLYPRITSAIRQVDSQTPILIGGMGYSAIEWLPYLHPTGDPRTVYVAHQYAPVGYTHQWWDSLTCTYPGRCDTDWDGEDDRFDRAWLGKLMETVDTFVAAHSVPVAVNEFGVMRWEPGAAAFMDDEIDLFEQRGINHALWEWQPLWEPLAEEVNAFNFRLGPDPANRSNVESSDLIDAILRYWERNSLRPSSAVTTTTFLPAVSHGSGRISAVNDFFYQLQNLDLVAIGETAYDLIVMDYAAEGGDETAFTAAEIAALKSSPGGDKIVLAYMSIGEAEDYRFYWQDDWESGNPTWLDVENPDWEGNYKVHYWDPGWQAVILNYTDHLLDAGFDGAYLDIIDAYEYYGDLGRSTAAQEMAAFVAAIRAHARSRDPDFTIFPQNAPQLAEAVPTYLDSVDGIGQEDIYYGYEGDDVMTPPAVSTELERTLDLFKNAGKLVLTVDYATTPSHVDDAYTRSQAKGYVPLVTVRDLDQLIINSGHRPD